eukprot:SAG11_NODE_2551_length_3229_cov_2.569649_2_plen_520_part_00
MMLPLLLLAAATALSADIDESHSSSSAMPSSLASSLTISVEPAETSLIEAQAQIRSALRGNRDRNIIVDLGPGVHRVPVGGLRLTADDSPAPGRMLTWAGRAGGTVLSGGDNVTGWSLLNDSPLPPGVMVAPAPATMAPGATARQLYVDGMRAQRTRMNASAFNASIAAAAPQPLVGCQWPGICLNSNKTSYSAASAAPITWSNPEDVEFVFSGAGGRGTSTMFDGYRVACWAEPRCTVEAIRRGPTNTTEITMKNPAFYNIAWRDGPITVNRPRTPPFIWIENVREHLAQPGQWYFDRSRRQVLYWPLPGQDMSQVTTVLAVEELLVRHDGVSNLRWSGITFEAATWLRPMQHQGYVENQGGACATCPPCPNCTYNRHDPATEASCRDTSPAHHNFTVSPGNVIVSRSTNVQFLNCTFQHLGAFGLQAVDGTQGMMVRACNFSDISAGAISLGSVDTYSINDTTQQDRNHCITDNIMSNTGVEYTGTASVQAFYVAQTTIAHNHIFNVSYDGIIIGWG